MSSFDLAVIGGGLVGSAIAWGAARLGASVALLDEGDVAFRAARGNFGLVWVQGKGAGMAPYAQWTQLSAKLWPTLQTALGDRTGVELGLEQPGGLYFCLSEDELEARASLVKRMHNESGDIGTRIIGRAEARAMVTGLGDDVVGASYCPMDGHANPLHLLRALHAGLALEKASYLPNRSVERIVPKTGGFVLSCGAEEISCARLVIAAGLGSRLLAPMVGLDMPVEPLRGQILVTERMRPFLPYPTHVVRQTQEGSVMLGDSHEDVGFDTGTAVPVMQSIAARNLRVFPALRDATLVRSWAALRVMSPDGFPIYEQSTRYPGAFSAACHSGVTLAGAHALAYAPAVLAGALPETLHSFSSERFHVQTH
jgi:glycine/D-amino acid oxidase-like deaminating enzyme